MPLSTLLGTSGGLGLAERLLLPASTPNSAFRGDRRPPLSSKERWDLSIGFGAFKLPLGDGVDRPGNGSGVWKVDFAPAESTVLFRLSPRGGSFARNSLIGALAEDGVGTVCARGDEGEFPLLSRGEGAGE